MKAVRFTGKCAGAVLLGCAGLLALGAGLLLGLAGCINASVDP